MKQITAKYLRLGSVEKAEEHYQSALKVMALKPYVDAAGIASMIEFIAESDPLVAKVKPEMVINYAILKKRNHRERIEHSAKVKRRYGLVTSNHIDGPSTGLSVAAHLPNS